MSSKLKVDTLGEAVTRALGQRLMSLLLYGSAASGAHAPQRSDVNTLLICDAVNEGLFDALTPVVRDWRRAGHPAPLIFTEREWRESADAFPIEYGDIRQYHRVLAGRDPWPGIAVDRGHLRRQLEHELKGKLVRLRQAYAALRAEPKQLAGVIGVSTGGFLTMLRATLRLAGQTPPAEPDALVGAAGGLVGFAPAGLGPLVAHATGARALALASGDPLPAAYLDAVTRTAEYVNRVT